MHNYLVRVRPRALLAFVLVAASSFTDAVFAQASKLEIVVQIPHSRAVFAVAFSADGTRVLSGSGDNTAKLWDAASGQFLRTFAGHSDSVKSVAFSPSGLHVLSGSNDGTSKIWETSSGKLLRTLSGHSEPVTSVAFSSDGKRVLSGSQDNTIRLWDAASGRLMRTFQGHSDWVFSVTFSPDGTRILSGSGRQDTTIKLWEATTGKLLRTFAGHADRVYSVAFSPDGTRILSGSQDKTIRLWEISTGQLLRTFAGHTHAVHSVSFSPDGTRFASGSRDKTIGLWDTASGKLERTISGHSDWVWSVAFSPDGAHVLSGSGTADNTVKLWEAKAGTLTRTFEGLSDEVCAAAFSPDGANVIAGGQDKTMKLWQTTTGKRVHTFVGSRDEVCAVAFSSDGKQVVSGGYDKTVKVWEVSTGDLLRTFEGHSDRVSSVAVSPNGRYVLSGSRDKTIKLWEAATGSLLRTFEGHSEGVASVAFSPDGARILSGSLDHTLRLWDLASGSLLRTFAGHSDAVRSIAFSADGSRAVSGSHDMSLKIWNVATGKVLRTLTGHSDWVFSVAVSPDGKRVLSGAGTGDNTLKLWDAATGRLLRTFSGHSSRIFAASFSRSGRQIVSASADTTIRLWDYPSGALLATLVGGRNEEWLAITPKGFFTASGDGARMLGAVRGADVMSIAQVYDHLYRPDLVEAVLNGDPDGKYRKASSQLNLEKILDSGSAPQVALIEGKTELAGGTIRLAVRITDTGGGIGSRVVWRINGQTQGNLEPTELIATRQPSVGRAVTVTETLRIDPSHSNAIELTTYNGAGLLASPVLRITVDKFGATTEERPNMHIFAIGVDKYRMADLELKYAVKDAVEFSQALEVVGSSLFAKVERTTLINDQVNEHAIGSVFDRIAAIAKPADVFVLFLAGHGNSIDGRYYYYPQSLDFKAGQSVVQYGIGQDKWQAWLAKVGHVQKSLLILDTCYAGAAGGLVRSVDIGRQTAMDHLRHATGRNLIAASRQAAFEGYRGHGVLTYALLEALHKEGEGDGGSVRVGGLADHVDTRVPLITQELFGQNQSPIRMLTGSDFPIGIRQSLLKLDEGIPKTPTHVLIRLERVRESPAADAQGEREVPVGFQVRVTEFMGEWAVVARNGEKLGYVPAASLSALH